MYPRKHSRRGSATAAAHLLFLLSACSEPTHPADHAGSDPTAGSTSGPEIAFDGGGGSSTSGLSLEAGTGAGDTSAFEPEWLPNLPLDSVAGVLTLVASTLAPGPNGLELYAAIRNDGEFPLCSAAMMLEFYDAANQVIGSASTGVQSGRLYRLPDSTTTISCVAPGQTAMAAATNLPEGLALDALKSIGHRFPAFQIDDAEPLPGAGVSELEVFDRADGSAYRGTVSNAADAPISDPGVSVFPVNAVGRPLGVATATAMLEIPPGGSWSFETSPVTERGVDQVAFAFASIVAE